MENDSGQTPSAEHTNELSASLESMYSVRVSAKGLDSGTDLPQLKGQTRVEENLYPAGAAQDIKDKNGERKSARYHTSFSSSDQHYHLRWKCEF